MSLSAITDRRLDVQPADVHNVLARHMLADGYDIVMDLQKSRGSLVLDYRLGRRVLDFFRNFASCPVRHDHRRLYSAESRVKLAEAERREAAAIAQAKQFLAERKDDVAAFIMEPIQGEGGDNHFRPEFFRAVRQLCDENDMILIFDEVQSGVGLTGKMWAFQHYGIEPDMFCFGKKTQVCGFTSNDRIMDVERNVFVESSRINSTWGGNLTDMVRSQRYFEVIEEEQLVENAASVGAWFVGELERFGREIPNLVSNVRGLGLMAAFDLPSAELRDATIKAMMANDLMVLASGQTSVRFRPPLNLSMEEAAEGIKRME